MIAIPILICLLFIACMVFIIGHIFGSFSRKKSLVTLARVATILVIVLFVGSRVWMARASRHGYGWCPWHDAHHAYYQADSTWRH